MLPVLAVRRRTALSSVTQQEQQHDAGEEPEDVREIRDLLRRGMASDPMKKPMTMTAGSCTTVMKIPRKMSVRMRAPGERTRYAPSTPAIAPDAPSIGAGDTIP